MFQTPHSDCSINRRLCFCSCDNSLYCVSSHMLCLVSVVGPMLGFSEVSVSRSFYVGEEFFCQLAVYG